MVANLPTTEHHSFKLWKPRIWILDGHTDHLTLVLRERTEENMSVYHDKIIKSN